MEHVTFAILAWIAPLENKKIRHFIAHGGRGSGKSENIARYLLLKMIHEKHRIIIARQTSESLTDSVYALIKRVIFQMKLDHRFKFTREKIICLHNNSEMMFYGLDINVDKILGVDNISYLWIEEAQFLKHYAWERIKPSIRKNGSQIIMSMNPRYATDCLYRAYIADPKKRPSDTHVVKVNWQDNPYFPEVLENERKQAMITDTDMYNHVWNGELVEHSAAQVFKGKWRIEAFVEPERPSPHCYYGLDFGYIDPTAAIRCYIQDDNLYITHELYDVKIDTNDIARRCEAAIPKFKNSRIIADSSRPETIAQMQKQGFRVESSVKGKNSVIEGIAHIRTFKEIIIHPRCGNTIDEFTSYSYKIDKYSGDVTDTIDDKAGNDHLIDALRYALESVMRRKELDYSNLRLTGSHNKSIIAPARY